ncbi:MAG: tetratricopeptide repeat protein [Acidobacteriota bacterium]
MMRPDTDHALLTEASAQFDRSEYEACARLCDEGLARCASDPSLYYMRGRCRQLLRRLDDALKDYTAAIALEPAYDDAYYHAGSILIEQAQYRRALEMLYALLQRAPGRSDAWALLGGALSKVGEHDHAIDCCTQALKLDANNTAALYNLSFAHAAKEEPEEALSRIDEALALDPGMPMFHLQRASVLLRQGAFYAGWREWEWRLEKNDFRALNVRSAEPGRWKGEPLDGRTILVWCEQGLGDTLQCVRFLPALKARGARVLFECQKELIPVLRTVQGADLVFERFRVCPEPYDFHIPVMSLPLELGLMPESIPFSEGYIDARAMRPFASQLPVKDGAISVGLAWEGSRLNPANHHRSGTPMMFAPLFGIPGCRFYSLQHEVPPEGLPSSIRHLGIRSMEQLAGAIARMDLVVTIDTSVAHLAGAMGKPVLLLLSALPDWRWQLERETTPWYASMRILRQRSLGAWMPLTIEASEHVRRRFERTTKSIELITH